MVDYSSWKTIELSSDEDDVHPFIDNGTLFRLRHEARLKKMEKRKQDEFAYECHKASYIERLTKLQSVIDEKRKENQDISDLEQQMEELQLEGEQLKEKENKLNKQVVSWYIDTICYPGFSKVSINDCSSKDDSTPEQFHNFISQNKNVLKRFGLLKSFDETKNFLISHPHILKKQSLYFLISYGIKVYLKEEMEKLRNISRQIVCLQHVLELFKIYNNSEEILRSFFTSIKLADQNCKFNFEKETSKVQKLIKKLVKSQINELESNEKLEETNSNNETNYRLDPEEVFESLPEDMQYCFLMKDKNRLANILGKMSKEEVEYHMKRCIDSGLWIPEK